MLTAIAHTGTEWTRVEDVRKISDYLSRDGYLLWAQAEVRDLDPATIATLAEEFDLHPLAVEDALNTRQRPKLEAYDTHLFVVMHQLDEVDGQLEAHQIACFIGKRFVLTIHESSDRTLREAMARCDRTSRQPERGPSYVMHALLDTIVDEYQTFATSMEEEIEALEDLALSDPTTPLQSTLYSLKQRVSRLRRYATPGERLLASLEEPARGGTISTETAALFRDVHDHTLRIIDQIRNVDELADAVIELQRAAQANALNEVTKKLTGWAAIIAVPTLIASTYGMNFALVPDEGSMTGFIFAVSLMAVAAIGLFAYFKRKDWL